MNTFFHILLNNVIPLSVMIGIGFTLQRAFKMDIKTLSKLNFYLFSPAVVFLMLYESELTMAILLQVLLFFSLFFISLYILTNAVIWIRGYKAGMKSAVRNSVLFYNSGNYALPLNQLVFVNDPFTLSIQIIVMMMQSLLPNTYGVYIVNAHKQKLSEIFRTIRSLPIIYAIPAAFLLRWTGWELPEPLYIPLKYIASAFIATALVTLGVQLGSMKWNIKFSDVILSNVMRLCVAPLLGFAIVWLLGIRGAMAQALVLSCCVPTSLSTVLLAVEYDNEPEFASQAVFASTIFSIFTVTLVIYFMKFIP